MLQYVDAVTFARGFHLSISSFISAWRNFNLTMKQSYVRIGAKLTVLQDGQKTLFFLGSKKWNTRCH